MKQKLTEREFLLAIFGIIFGLLIANGTISLDTLNSDSINKLVEGISGSLVSIVSLASYVISRGLAKNESKINSHSLVSEIDNLNNTDITKLIADIVKAVNKLDNELQDIKTKVSQQ